MPASDNPLVSDRDVEFLLYEVLDATSLCALPHFADHSRDTFDLLLRTTRRLAREVLFPVYRPLDLEPPVFRDGRMFTHPVLKTIYPQLVNLGLLSMTRPTEVGGQQLPAMLNVVVQAYLGAANCALVGYVGLTTGAAHLIEAFGSEWLRENFMRRMYSGEWTGTMALTEPQAGSSLGDVRSTATPASDGTYRIRGSKIFISGADQDFTDNIVNMVLARIDGAPSGTKGISLFAVPKRRIENDALTDNDVAVAGAIHKIGWKGLPSLALNFGERGDCHGWLVGEANRGLAHMFQMMNEARLMVGASGVATAMVAYHEAVAYARTRPQGRALSQRDLTQPQIAIVEHPDVRRMLLRSKAIVEGSFALILTTARFADIAAHGTDDAERARARLLLDLLTPVAKTFPAERGFDVNVLAVQIHGGYGYSSEYLPEAWMRDQKLNSIHEGTTGIQSLDLLGRKVVAGGGEALRLWGEEIEHAVSRARSAGVDPTWCSRLSDVVSKVSALTMQLAQAGLSGDTEMFLAHSTDYMELFSIVTIAWQWMVQATAANVGLARGASQDEGFYQGKLRATQYWFATEVSRVEQLVALCASGEDSYLRMRSDWY